MPPCKETRKGEREGGRKGEREREREREREGERGREGERERRRNGINRVPLRARTRQVRVRLVMTGNMQTDG